MSEAHVNLHLRNDVIGDVLRQKETLDRVSEVLCDGLEDPVAWWLTIARGEESMNGANSVVDRLRAIADLIESERL